MSRTSHKAGASTKVSPLRLQKEKEDAYADIDRGRDKYEKLQVRLSISVTVWQCDSVTLSCNSTVFAWHQSALNWDWWCVAVWWADWSHEASSLGIVLTLSLFLLLMRLLVMWGPSVVSINHNINGGNSEAAVRARCYCRSRNVGKAQLILSIIIRSSLRKYNVGQWDSAGRV